VNEALREELLKMREEDLNLRTELLRDGSLFHGYAERMAELHRRHNQRMRAILAEHGWPGRSLVGEDANAAAWLLLQHAILDPDLMRSAVPMIDRAVQVGETDAKYLAFLVDRIRTLEGLPQIYGTQYDWDAEGELSPLPIDEPALVDERRRTVGLETLAENTRRLRAQAKSEGDSPPKNYDQRQREAADWARSVGWKT
jgi:hypothetical protein